MRQSEASAFEDAVRKLDLNLHEARWGTLIGTCLELQSVRMPLLYWPSSFKDKPVPADADEQEQESYRALPLVTEAVRDAGW